MRSFGIALAALAFISGMPLASESAQAGVIISIDPRATYLRTNDAPGALDSTPIDLAALGIAGGDLVRLERLGAFRAGEAFDDNVMSMVGVFSGSSVLLPSTLLNRVQDAIDAGMDVTTLPTFTGNLPTNIPEDFNISDITIQVPVGARYLFVSPNDAAFGDNSDPNGDYGLRITVVPEPASLVMVGIGSLLIGPALAWRRRTRRAATT